MHLLLQYILTTLNITCTIDLSESTASQNIADKDHLITVTVSLHFWFLLKSEYITLCVHRGSEVILVIYYAALKTFFKN